MDEALRPAQASQRGGFVHLHAHSDYSAFDGFSTVKSMVDWAVANDSPAQAVADHGIVAAHPELAKRCEDAGIKPIFGLEAYLQEDRFRRTRKWWVKIDPATGMEFEVDPTDYPEAERKTLKERTDSAEVRWGYEHITLWAMDEVGLRNLWAMSTESYRDGLFDGKPRLDYDTLRRHAEGVIASTGCLRGPLARPFLAGDEARMQHNLGRLMDIFGDRLYVEIHTNTLEDQVKVNHRSVQVARDYSLPMIACVDSHYTEADEDFLHGAWMQASQGKTIADDSDVFQSDDTYHMRTEAEVREALAYLGEDVVEEAVATTVALADRCTATIAGEPDPPVFSNASDEHPDPVLRDFERLHELCMSNWDLLLTPQIEAGHYTLEEAEARYEMEMSLLVERGFCGYYLVVADYVGWARKRSLVGPSRGSGGGSLLAYLARITGMDPLLYGLIFERFLNPGRTGLPDFDVDFETWIREPLKQYLRERWGEDYTLSIGTVMRLQPKGAFDAVDRVLRDTDVPTPEYADINRFKRAVEVSDMAAAGTDVSWDQFVTDHEDLVVELGQKYPEFMVLVEAFVGRVRGYGKHPAGFVISTRAPLTDLPQRLADDGSMISQFDHVALEILGYVKFDLLTIRNLDTINLTLRKIKDRYGIDIDPTTWTHEYEDPQVWEGLASGNTLGCFQIETKSGTEMTLRVNPRSLDDLSADVTLNRPGPMRAKLDERFIQRRHGREAVSYPDPRLEEALGETYGVPIYQEQIMAICQIVAGYTLGEADDVRRILGKKKVEQVEAAGAKFIPAAVDRGMTQGDAERLWAQLAEFAKYGFNKSHAMGYSIISYWCVAGRTRIYDWDAQEYTTVSKAFKRGVSRVAAYDEATGRTVPANVDRVVKTGRKAMYALRTKSAKHLYASGDHLVLTDRGWVRLRDITTEDRVASERRVSVMEPGRRAAIAEGMRSYWESLPEDEAQRRIRALNDGQDFVFRSDRARQRWAVMDQVERQERVAALIDSATGGTWAARRQGTSPECGHRYASLNEREVCRWFNRNGLEHESQVFIGGRPADFRCQGVFIEFDGVGRDDAYFEEKFGDEPYVVVRDRAELDRDLGFLRERELLEAGGVVTFEPVVSVEAKGEVMMYDLVMKDDPHNFLANGVVVHNTAWLKVHFPPLALAASLTTIKADRVPEFVTEARRLGYAIDLPCVNRSGVDFTPADISVRYGLAQVPGVGVATAAHIVEHAPYASVEDFRERAMGKGSPVNAGHLRALALVGAFDDVVDNRRALVQQLTDEHTGVASTCIFKDESAVGPGGLPCTFDWANEPDPPMVSKGRGKNKEWFPKPPPAKCTRACRNFTPPEPVDPADIAPYGKADLRQIEREHLGTWITSTPFDRFDPEDLESLATATEIERGPVGREYVCAAVVESVSTKVDRTSKTMAFVTLNIRDGLLRAVVFGSVYPEFKPYLVQDDLVLVVLRKSERGCQVQSVLPV